jgi:O-antigen/teichoic acid export membrane protein
MYARQKWARNPQARTILSSVLSRAVALIAPFIITPMMLNYLGPSSFALWVTGTSIISLAAFMDFGIGNSLLTRLAGHFGRSDAKAARHDIGVSYRVLGYIFLAGFAIFALGLGFVLLWPGARPTMLNSDLAILAIMFVFFLVGLPLTVVYRIMYAHQQIGIFNILQIVSAIISVVLAVWSIKMAFPSWAVVALLSSTPVFVMLGASLWFFHFFPQYKPRGSDFAMSESARAMLRLGAGHLGLGILTAVGMNLDLSLILYSLNSEAVTNFAMPSRIGLLLQTVIATAFMPLWSFNGAAMARKEYDWVRRNTVKMSIGGGLLIAVLGVVLTLGIDPIMQFWTGRAFPDQKLVIAMMTLFSVIVAVISPWNMVLNAAGQVRVQVWAWGAFVIVSTAAKLLVIPHFGAWIAAAISAMAYLLCIAPVMVISALKVTRQV